MANPMRYASSGSRFVASALLVLGSVASASAAELADLGDSAVEAHAFVSQGFIKTTANNYLAASERGSFDFTEMGVNFTMQPLENLRIGLQLFGHRLGDVGNFNTRADWFYLDYRWRDWLGFRAGRVKVPFGLYNEINDVDSARVPILLPSSIYPAANRDFLLAQTGGELYGNIGLRRAGTLRYSLYGGSIFINLVESGAAAQGVSLVDEYVAGGRLFWETPIDGLRVGGSVQDLRFDVGLMPPGAMPPVSLTAKLDALLWVASIEYAAHDLLLAAEYSRWLVKVEDSTDTSMAILANGTTTSERTYGLLAYRVRSWFEPGVYYSLFFPNVDNRVGRENMQHDVAATLRFDINPYWLVKLEGHYMHGTAGLSATLNGNTMPAALTEDWGVFLVKTTAYF